MVELIKPPINTQAKGEYKGLNSMAKGIKPPIAVKVVKNSILSVDYTERLRAGGMSLTDAIQEAGETRFVPIILTTFTAIGGLIPLAIEFNPLYSLGY